MRSNYVKQSPLLGMNPAAITVNGEEDVAGLCHDDFVKQQNYKSEMELKLAVYSRLAQAADDVKLGKFQKIDEVFDDILAELDLTN